jgi:hypothetical protein
MVLMPKAGIPSPIRLNSSVYVGVTGGGEVLVLNGGYSDPSREVGTD